MFRFSQKPCIRILALSFYKMKIASFHLLLLQQKTHFKNQNYQNFIKIIDYCNSKWCAHYSVYRCKQTVVFIFCFSKEVMFSIWCSFKYNYFNYLTIFTMWWWVSSLDYNLFLWVTCDLTHFWTSSEFLCLRLWDEITFKSTK